MKKIILLVFLTTAFFQFASSQNTIAKLKFEDAEQAYANNNFELALHKLIEVETLLKSTNPQVLHLKINSQSKIIKKNPLNDYALIENTRKLCSKYLIDYEQIPDNENNYRDIYKISETLKSYPENEQEFLAQKKMAEEKQLEEAAKPKIEVVKEQSLSSNSKFPGLDEFKKSKELFQAQKAKYKDAVRVYKLYRDNELIKLQNSLRTGGITKSEYIAAVKLFEEE
ncbi:MAG: hypothetical protein V4547_11285 [Bacteroidota bacterium]